LQNTVYIVKMLENDHHSYMTDIIGLTGGKYFFFICHNAIDGQHHRAEWFQNSQCREKEAV